MEAGLPLRLLGVEVGCGTALLDLAYPAKDPGREEHHFHQQGLTGPGVREQHNVPYLFCSESVHVRTSPIDIDTIAMDANAPGAMLVNGYRVHKAIFPLTVVLTEICLARDD